MAVLKFKPSDRTLQEHFVSLADYLENLSGLDAKDEAVSKRLAGIIKGSKIEFVGDELRCTVIGPEANELSRILTLPNKNGVETPILSAADYSNPENLLGAVKKFVEYRSKKESQLEEANISLCNELYEIKKGITDTNKALDQASNKKVATNKQKKKFKPVTWIVLPILSLALGGSLLGNFFQFKKNKDLAAQNSNLNEQNIVLKEENESLKDTIVIYEEKANELDEVIKILEDNGIDVTDISAVSDSVQKLFDDAYLTNDDSKAMLQVFISALEKAGLNIEDLKDENGNYSIENVEETMQAFVEDYLKNMAELSSIQKTVNDLYKQSGLKTADGKEITPADFKTLGGEDGAIQYIVNFYNSLYKDAVEEGKIKDSQIVDLMQQLEDLKKQYKELQERYDELEQSTHTPEVEVGGSKNDNVNTENKDPVAEEEIKPEDSTGKNQQVSGGELSDPSLDLGD